mmetsp:Transcript_19707/g.29017  ORF Transcript_19707/g.29017 Transcript_19707/m.29017 type:complete len:152 (+) Transcript_19707:88-543(+)
MNVSERDCNCHQKKCATNFAPLELMMPSLEKGAISLGAEHQLPLRCDHSREARNNRGFSVMDAALSKPYVCHHFDPDEYASIQRQSLYFAGEQSPVSGSRYARLDTHLTSVGVKAMSPNKKPVPWRNRALLENVREPPTTTSKMDFSANAA